jgi:hypothetical protein
LSWQEELHKLDGELAAGQISADEYRVRRDQVLSSAVSPGQESKTNRPPEQEATQFVAPVTLPPPPSPQPPQPDTGDADKTQIVSGDSDRTQTVGGWQTSRPSGPDADRTQAVPGVPGQAYAGGMPPRPAPGQSPFPPPPGYQQGWQADDELSPPWAGTDFPPLMASGNPDWIRQGPEVFEESGKSKKGAVAAIIAGVLVVALVGVGIWWFATKDKNNNGGGSTQTQSTTNAPTSTTPSGPPRPLNGVDGQVDDKVSGPITVSQAAEKHQFSPDEATTFGECSASDGQVEVLYRETWYTLVHVFRCRDAAGREPAVAKLLKQQEAYGFKALAAPQNLVGMILENATDVPDAPVDARVFYASGDNIVRVEVRGHSSVDVNDGLAEVLTVTTKNYPVKK